MLGAALVGVERDGDAGLQRGCGGFQVLKVPQLFNQRGTVSAGTNPCQ